MGRGSPDCFSDYSSSIRFLIQDFSLLALFCSSVLTTNSLPFTISERTLTLKTPITPTEAAVIATHIFDKLKDLDSAERKLVFATLGPKLNPDFHANVAKLNAAKARIDAAKRTVGKAMPVTQEKVG